MLAGGAGNAANNVAALGGRARLAGIVGDDAEGRRLMTALAAAVDRKHVVARSGLSNARQDAYPRRRRPFGQTAIGPDRPGNRLVRFQVREPETLARGCGRRLRAVTPWCSRTTARV